LGGEPAEKMTKNSPYIKKFILIPEGGNITVDTLPAFIETTAKAYECDKVLNMVGCFENSILIHPSQPEYNWPKKERIARCNVNCYDYAFKHAGYPEVTGKIGELYFNPEEEAKIKKEIDDIRGKDGFVILWGLAGTGSEKTWPWYGYAWSDLVMKYKNVKIISTGDKPCEILELVTKHPRQIKKSGKWSMMESMIAAKYVDLVVTPNTGLIHAAGCFDTPKICILSHCTIEQITKYFKNDYSIEADIDKAPCAPCFRLIYDAGIQCPIDEEVSGSCLCMALGQSRERVMTRITEVIDKCQK
jgi:ADP-heptose:LPS heptosyltransferase